jgi:hypothetical protein
MFWLQNLKFPQTFPRFVQHAIWRYCSQTGLDVCNGNRINDVQRCDNLDCRVRLMCDRVALRKAVERWDEHRREQGPLWARNSISCAKRKAPAQGVGSRGHRNARPQSGARHSAVPGRITLGICMPSRREEAILISPRLLRRKIRFL